MPGNPGGDKETGQQKPPGFFAVERYLGDLIPLPQGSRSDFLRRHSTRTASVNVAVTPNEAIDAISIALRKEEFMDNLLL
jgi:hypothetical protein